MAERETVDSAVRQVDFLDTEIAEVERLIAAEALSWPEVKRLMTVPGVNVIVAAGSRLGAIPWVIATADESRGQAHPRPHNSATTTPEAVRSSVRTRYAPPPSREPVRWER